VAKLERRRGKKRKIHLKQNKIDQGTKKGGGKNHARFERLGGDDQSPSYCCRNEGREEGGITPARQGQGGTIENDIRPRA